MGLKGCASIAVPVGGTALKRARRLRGAGWSDRVGGAGSLGFTPAVSGQTGESLTEAGCFASSGYFPVRFTLQVRSLQSRSELKRRRSEKRVRCRSQREYRF